MNLRTIALTTVASVLAFSAPALAGGSYATNTYVNGTETGTRDIKVDNVITVKGHQVNTSEALKFETNFPTANGGVYYDGTGLTGGLTVSTNLIDPFVEGVYSNQVEVLDFTDITKVNVIESVDYYNDIYTHTIEAGSK